MKFKLLCLLILFIIIVYILKKYNKDTFINYTLYDQYPVMAGNIIYYLKNSGDYVVANRENSNNENEYSSSPLKMQFATLSENEDYKKNLIAYSTPQNTYVFKDIDDPHKMILYVNDINNRPVIDGERIKKILYLLIRDLLRELENTLIQNENRWLDQGDYRKTKFSRGPYYAAKFKAGEKRGLVWDLGAIKTGLENRTIGGRVNYITNYNESHIEDATIKVNSMSPQDRCGDIWYNCKFIMKKDYAFYIPKIVNGLRETFGAEGGGRYQTTITHVIDALHNNIFGAKLYASSTATWEDLDKLIYNCNANIFNNKVDEIFTNTVSKLDMRGNDAAELQFYAMFNLYRDYQVPFWSYILHTILGQGGQVQGMWSIRSSFDPRLTNDQALAQWDKIMYYKNEVIVKKIQDLIKYKVDDIMSKNTSLYENIKSQTQLAQSAVIQQISKITYITAFGDNPDTKYIIQKNNNDLTVFLKIELNNYIIMSLSNIPDTDNKITHDDVSEKKTRLNDLNKIYIYKNDNKFKYRYTNDTLKYFKLNDILYEAIIYDYKLTIKQADNNYWNSITIKFNTELKKLDLFCGINNYFYIITTTNDDLHQLNKIYNEEGSVFESNTNTFTMNNNNDIIDYNIDEGNDTIKIIQS